MEYDDELKGQISRFKDETGLSDSDIEKIARDNYKYSDSELASLQSNDGVGEQEQRELVAESTLTALTSDDAIEAVKSLREDVGFSTDQIVTILEDSRELIPDVLSYLQEDQKQIELLVKVGGVSTDDLTELLDGKPVDEKLGIIEESFSDIFSNTFPDFDWEKATLMLDEDTKFTDLDVDDPLSAEITGEPDSDRVVSFADRVKNSPSDDKHR